jgi:hypothetical protein
MPTSTDAMTNDRNEKIRVPLPVMRNRLVPLAHMRKAGAHGKTNKALRRQARQTLLSGGIAD